MMTEAEKSHHVPSASRRPLRTRLPGRQDGKCSRILGIWDWHLSQIFQAGTLSPYEAR